MKNKLSITIATGLFTFFFPITVFAQTMAVNPGARGVNKEANLSRVSTACVNAINARITSLNNATGRIGELKKLTDTQKQQFTGQISSDISALQTLQTQCTNDFNAGNIQALRTDYRNVFTELRIYAEFLPQIHLLIAADTMSTTAQKLSDLATKLQSRIQAAGNPSNLTSLLSDMQAKIADANTQYSTVESQIASLTAQIYDNNPSGTTAILKGAREEIRTGATDLKAAFSDARQIVQELKAMHTTVTANPSPTH